MTDSIVVREQYYKSPAISVHAIDLRAVVRYLSDAEPYSDAALISSSFPR